MICLIYLLTPGRKPAKLFSPSTRPAECFSSGMRPAKFACLLISSKHTVVMRGLPLAISSCSAPREFLLSFNHLLFLVCWYYLETPANINDRKSPSSAIYPTTLLSYEKPSWIHLSSTSSLVSPVSSVIRPWCLKQVSLLLTASSRTPNLPTNRTPNLHTNIQQGMWV